jgi:hypothetical protein
MKKALGRPLSLTRVLIFLKELVGGLARNRTGVQGFAGFYPTPDRHDRRRRAFMGAFTASRCNPDLKTHYRRLRGNAPLFDKPD